MEDSETKVCVPQLDIILTFKKNLEDICVKDSIDKAFKDLKTNILQISFEETHLNYIKDETECHFTIHGDINKAELSLDTLISSLRGISEVQIRKCKSTDTKETNHCNGPKVIQKEIRNALQDSENRENEVVKDHEKKMIETQRKIDDINSRDEYEILSEKDVQNREILLLKLEECKLQKMEFVKGCKRHHDKLRNLNTSKVKSDDVSRILRSVSIECSRLRNALPIYAKRSDIVNEVMSKQVSVILGETGSGKSTQMPQYLLEAGLAEKGFIICTQPRRIAALSLAERIASENFQSVGNVVGYKAGIAKKCGPSTKLFFTTDHSLLNECLKDPELREYSCIIVDEAHERSIYTDILLGMIKLCLQKRPELKVIITSATIDPGIFIKYFNSGPELRVSGRTFPVDLFYSEEASDDFEKYEEKAVSKAVQIHTAKEPGDILVFLTSPVEIMRCCEEFQLRCKDRSDFKCFPLHGQLLRDEQKEVFEKLPQNERKIVFATNCAETSITIDGIKHVIDTGVAKEMKYDPKRNMNQLGVHAISQSSANQRKGRAGRTASGKCYRLYSKDGFEAMESINEPEILRVHLGKAVLKLSELGVNIQNYDFVQAPSETALCAAINTLEYLGAITNNHITDLGQWISKMPFDPKLGYILFKAQEKNILFDAVVLAAVISNGSDFFYRGFTEKESQVVAQSKLRFGSDYGDTFTWLQVYQAWIKIPDNKKQKASWCHSHGINSKSIGLAHQCVEDVCMILSKDFNINMTKEFSTQTETANELRKLLFVAYAESVSNFSANLRAGYFSLVSERQVHIHPSSIIKTMNLKPEWVVYTSLMKTSQEFIKGVTVVEETWINELINARKLSIDLKTAKMNKFLLIHKEEVGPSIFRNIVGPGFSKLKSLEEEIYKTGMMRFSLELSRNLGSLEIHSPEPMNQSVQMLFDQLRAQVIEKLMSEDDEFHLNIDKSIVSPSPRILIGKGGCVKKIFMPYQTDKVMIKRIPSDVTEDHIKAKFQVFGEIKAIIPFKCNDPWGFIQFGSTTEALAAVQATHNDEIYAGVLKLNRDAHNVKNMFEVRLSWIRRRIKGQGTAFISNFSQLDVDLLVNQNITVGKGCVCRIKPSKKGEDLVVLGIGFSARETEIREAIMNLLGPRREHNKNIRVSILRENVSLTKSETDTILRDFESQIRRFVKQHNMEDESFKISLLKPQEKSIYYVSFIHFSDPIRGFEISKKIKKRLVLNGQMVEVSPSLKTIVLVPQKIKEACKERFKELISGLAQYHATELTWKNLKKDFALEIKSSEAEKIVIARDLISKELEGEVIDCSVNHILKCLLNKPGQEYLQRIEKNNNCVIITDYRCNKVHLYGSLDNVSKIKVEINSYLSNVEGLEQRLFHLRGSGKPPGLMKVMMHKYGPLLDGLIDKFRLKSIIIDWKKQSIQLLGSQVALDETIGHLNVVEKEVSSISHQEKETFMPDCMVCLCPVESTDSLYRLEVCGHAYCIDCLKLQISHAVNNKEYPFTCTGEGCDSLFVLKDIKFALSRNWIKQEKFLSMALNAFVAQNKDKYKFCLTPNCPVVYEITTDEMGCQFCCPLCFASICTSCHKASHSGITCHMAKGEEKLVEWMQEDTSSRKICPGCQNVIEKSEGCNKMHCLVCHIYFCWLCRQICPNEQECYTHLRIQHGGFF